MPNRRTLLALASGALFLTLPDLAHSREPLAVVASFSILGDVAANVGGEHARVETIVGPDEDSHVFEPTPADARLIGQADLLLVNGLEFEAWLPRLVTASGFRGRTVVASEGIEPIRFDGHAHGHSHGDGDGHHHHGEFDPHVWQDVSNVVIYARNIADAMADADPGNAADYRANAEAYTAKLEALDAQIRARIAQVPAERRKVATGHEAFGYFAKAYGIEFIAPNGVSTESEASAADVARIIDQIRAENISAVFMENVTNTRLIQQIARETGASIGGALYSDALSKADGPASTYVDMVRFNADQILRALGSN